MRSCALALSEPLAGIPQQPQRAREALGAAQDARLREEHGGRVERVRRPVRPVRGKVGVA